LTVHGIVAAMMNDGQSDFLDSGKGDEPYER
jgi:hypothetical protein